MPWWTRAWDTCLAGITRLCGGGHGASQPSPRAPPELADFSVLGLSGEELTSVRCDLHGNLSELTEEVERRLQPHLGVQRLLCDAIVLEGDKDLAELGLRSGMTLTAVLEDKIGLVSMQELRKHNKEDDLWICVARQVLDVTKWLPLHPGGQQALLAYAGTDATEDWMIIHPPGTIERMRRAHPGLIRVGFMRDLGDIGVFGEHSGSPGIEYLSGKGPTPEAAAELMLLLGRMSTSGYQLVDVPVVPAATCKRLVEQLDEEHSGEPDLKLPLSKSQLIRLVGPKAVADLYELFGARVDSIWLRRVEAHGQCINFHFDVSEKTMQVLLNGEEDFSGGRLMYVTSAGFERPARFAGCATIHDDKVAHGVTFMESGVRYSLFLLKEHV